MPPLLSHLIYNNLMIQYLKTRQN